MSDTKAVLIPKRYKHSDQEVVIYKTKAFDITGELAYRLIEKHAVISGEPDGEDSAGRQKGKLMSPSDVVIRSFELAELFVKAAQERGHIFDIPEPIFHSEALED